MPVLKHINNIILIFVIFFIVSSCNSLFYYPNKKIFATPENVQLKYDNFTIPSTDNVKLNAWLIHAKNEKPIATILHFHGNGENISNHFLFFAWLAYLGFDVIEFDYRGYGLSTGKISRSGLVQDGIAAIQWAQKNLRSKEFFIIAQSLGGAVAVPSFVIGNVTNVNALVLDSTFASYREVARLKLSKFWLTWPFQFPLSFLVTDDLSSIHYIKSVNVPILFLHGEQDPIVPFESGYLLYAAANEPKEFWRIPGEGHITAFSGDENWFRKELVGYLCRHLKNKNLDCNNLYTHYADPQMKFEPSLPNSSPDRTLSLNPSI